LPVLDQLAASHQASDLVVLAVNVGDREADYWAYVEESGYEHVQVVRDGTRATARLYRVRSIPVTYVLDREGIIRHVHVGYGRALPERLADEIAALLE
jgi:cytochrome c biogenesis protein CcmG/thiol:disulfide interchange protein DsbE